MRKRGLYLVCQSREFCVSECLDEGWPGHQQPFPLKPLLQDPQCDFLCLSITIVINDAHSTACLVIKEDLKHVVLITDLLMYFETK